MWPTKPPDGTDVQKTIWFPAVPHGIRANQGSLGQAAEFYSIPEAGSGKSFLSTWYVGNCGKNRYKSESTWLHIIIVIIQVILR